MTLTRPAPGQPLSAPSGPAVMDEYADAIEASQLDITTLQTTVGGITIQGSPDVVYTDTFPDIAASVLHSADAVSDSAGSWLAASPHLTSTPTLDTTTTPGRTVITCDINVPSGGGTSGSVYCNLAGAGVDVNGHTEFDMDVRFTRGNGAVAALQCEVVFASGLDLTGTVVTKQISGQENSWQTYVVGKGALSTVRSFGVRKRAAGSGSSSQWCTFKIDNVVMSATSSIDSALAVNNRAVVVPPSFVETVPQGTHTLDPSQSILDLRQSDSNQTKFRNVYSFRDRLIDESGTTDVTQAVAAFIAALGPGDILTAPPGARYLVNGHIDIAKPDITIDMQGAVFFSTAHLPSSVGNPAMFSVIADYVTLNNWRIMNKGMPNQTHIGSALATVAGTPTVVGTTRSLNVIGDEVRIPVNTTQNDPQKTFRYARDEFGYIQFDLTLSQATPVASDCVVTVTSETIDPMTGQLEIQYTTTVTPLTSTPTVYPIKFRPTDLNARTRLTIKKTKTGSPIIVTSTTGYRRVQYRASGDATLDFSQNSGIVVGGANYCTINNYVGEGMGGDSMQIRAGRGLIVDGWIARATGRENCVLTHGTDCEVRNFLWCGGARDTIDIEPEAGSAVYIEDFRFKNGFIGTSWNIAVACSGPERIDGVVMEDIMIRTDIGGVWGGPSGMHNYTIKNMTYVNERTDTTLGAMDFRGSDLRIENLVSDCPVNIYASNAVIKGVWVKPVIATGSFSVFAAGADVQDVLVGGPDDPWVPDGTTPSFNPVILQADTTYRNIEVPSWKAEFGNSYKGALATQLGWLPHGMDLFQSGARQVRGLSGTTTPANNLRGLALPVTAGQTTATVAFAARTDVMQLPGTSLTATGPHETRVKIDDVVDSGAWYGTYNAQDTRKAITGATYSLGTPWGSGDANTAATYPFPRGIVTFTTAVPHDLLVGDKVGVAGMAIDTFNSLHPVTDPRAHNSDSWEYTVQTVPTTTTWTGKFTWGDPGANGGAGTMSFGPSASAAMVQRWMRALSTLADPDITVTGGPLTALNGYVIDWGASLGDLPATLFSAESISLSDYKQRDWIGKIDVDTIITGGFVVTGKYYVYRTAGRSFEGQPLAGRAAVEILLTAGKNSVGIGTGGGNFLYNQTTDLVVTGFTIWRAGPFDTSQVATGNTTLHFTKRVDFPGLTDFQHSSGATDRETSVSGVPWTTVDVTGTEIGSNNGGAEADTNYGVWITPSWPTPVAVTAKRTTGFDVTFGVACPTGNGTFDWGLIR